MGFHWKGGLATIFALLTASYGIPIGDYFDQFPSPINGNVQEVRHFRDIAAALNIPEDSSSVIRDFLTKSFIEMEQIAESNVLNIYNRTFSGNAIVVNGSTLVRSAEFYNFLERSRDPNNLAAQTVVSGNWDELKNYINDGFARETIIESIKYVVYCRYITYGKIAAQIHWTRVKQIGSVQPIINKDVGNFIVAFGTGVSDQNVQEIVNNKPIVLGDKDALYRPNNYGPQGSVYKQSYVVQKTGEKGPTIYVTHVYVSPETDPSDTSIGALPQSDSKTIEEYLRLKAEHLALKEKLEMIVKQISQTA